MRIRSIASWSIAFSLALIPACGDSGPGDLPDSGPGVMDSGPIDGAVSMRCGNGMVEGTETCDDANTTADDGCSATCQLECGDGTVNGDELCDTAIADGETGACPTDCSDGDACTTDALSGSECAVECVHGAITTALDGDGCCPSGADATTDDDCTSICGNGTVETGEACDTAIAAGAAGACPTDCDDAIACTTDTLTGTACAAVCSNVEITTPVDGDGCCPAGATVATDDDCAGCGDGSVVAPETCDTGIASGAGSCPTATSCDDADACTADSVIAAGTCMAACSNAAIAAGSADTCCPTGATIGTDVDCAARCGDGIVTAPEQCDPPTAGSCSATCTTLATPTAFRFTDMNIRDPHVWLQPLFGCSDVTDMGPFGQPSVNAQIETAITTDSDSDGVLGLNVAAVFRPLNQAAATTPLDVSFPDCSAPLATTSCTLPAAGMRVTSLATNLRTGTCLGVIAGTTHGPYTPEITTPTGSPAAACFVSEEETLTVVIAGAAIDLERAQVGGIYSGAPASAIVTGLIRGFITEAEAASVTVDIPLIGLRTLSSLLPGGTGCCAPHDDRDYRDGAMMGPRGWWMYLNFDAVVVPYTEL